MRRLLVVVLAVLWATVVPADQLTIARQATPDAPHPLIGAWVTDGTPDDPTDAPGITVFNADGSVITVSSDAPSAGAWESTGPQTAMVTLVQIIESEEFSGTVTVRADITVAETGDTFTGDCSWVVAGADRVVIESGIATISGTRIYPEPMGESDQADGAIPTWSPAVASGSTDTDGLVEVVGESALAGVAPERLPLGKPGEVSVIQTGAVIPGFGAYLIPVVVRNNTDNAIRDVLMSPTVTSDDGNVLGEIWGGVISPFEIPAGGIGVGYINYGDPGDLAEGHAYEVDFVYTLEDDPTPRYKRDMLVSDATLNHAGLDGIATNPGEITMMNGVVTGLCFDETGEIAGIFSGSTDSGDNPAGSSGPFSADFTYADEIALPDLSAADTCASWLVGITALLVEPEP